MWAEGADGLIIPRFHSECCWHSGTSQPGHDSTKLLPQRGHQTSCTGGPFVLCFRSLFLACWPEWWKFGCWEQGEQRASGWTEPLRAMPHWFRLKKKKKLWTPLNNLAVPRLLPRFTATCPNQPPAFAFTSLVFLQRKTHSRTQLRPTRTLAEPRGAPQTATIMRTSLICLSEWGGLQHRRVIN